MIKLGAILETELFSKSLRIDRITAADSGNLAVMIGDDVYRLAELPVDSTTLWPELPVFFAFAGWFMVDLLGPAGYIAVGYACLLRSCMLIEFDH